MHSRRVTVSHGEKNGHAVTRREGKSQKFDLDSTMVDSRPSSTKTHGVSTAWSRCITVSSRWVHGELTASHGEVHGAVTVHHGAPRCVHGEPRCLHGAFTVTTARSRWGSRCAHGELGSGIKASVSWDYPHLLLRRGLPWSAVTHRTEKIDSRRATVRSRWSTVRSRWARRVHGASTVCSRSFTVRSRWSGFWGRRERRRELRLNF